MTKTFFTQWSRRASRKYAASDVPERRSGPVIGKVKSHHNRRVPIDLVNSIQPGLLGFAQEM
jgi:hypothetical protein